MIDNSNIGNKTSNIFKQTPTCNGYYFVSELNDVLQSGNYYSFGNNKIEWFVDEVIEIENKMNFYFKGTKKDNKLWLKKMRIILGIITHVGFVKKKLFRYKVRDHCHLTGKYRGAAYEKCNKCKTKK